MLNFALGTDKKFGRGSLVLAAVQNQKTESVRDFGLAGVLLMAARRALGLSDAYKFLIPRNLETLLLTADKHGVLPTVMDVLEQQGAFTDESTHLLWKRKRALQVSHFHSGVKRSGSKRSFYSTPRNLISLHSKGPQSPFS